MKRILPAGFLMLALAASAWSFDGEIGFLYGFRTLKNSDLRGVFGTGTVAVPTVTIRVSHTGSIGLAYEAGYKQEAEVGLFGDLFSLSVSGFELFYRQEWPLGRLTPYLKVGPGLSLYKISIDSPFLTAYDVKGSDISFHVALGLRAEIIKRVYLSAEVKYGVLWIDPYDDKIDLGGFRAMAGLGFRI
ncbi:MAG: hypothetical protein PHI34_14825 [Acidobacteriota bacterium]|nr:hypothetical protein [Acidobacteriota bacterium]